MIYEHRMYTVIPGMANAELSRVTYLFPLEAECWGGAIAGSGHRVIGARS